MYVEMVSAACSIAGCVANVSFSVFRSFYRFLPKKKNTRESNTLASEHN